MIAGIMRGYVWSQNTWERQPVNKTELRQGFQEERVLALDVEHLQPDTLCHTEWCVLNLDPWVA
jgi:hypothetical protein